ncbi:MAG TPA: M48 family metallopeptidase [Elusimicrobiota bacterium]|nr:M48 family metallopeptidase [Elusimicrobiota bacterium]
MERGVIELYLAFLALEAAVELVLNELNLRHYRAKRGKEEWKALEYALVRGRFARAAILWDTGTRLLDAFLLLPVLGAAARALAPFLPMPYAESVLFCLGYALLRHVDEVPLDLYDTFSIEQRFGFNRTTPGAYALDGLKSAALAAAFGVPTLLCAFLLIDRAGPRWWLWAFALSMAFHFLLMHVSPAFIEPLFNRFEPLADGELRERALALAGKVGFPGREIQVKDASRRTGHSNAYFTGVGRAKRIVFYDTLLAELTVEQSVGVLAHELGHWKLRHVEESMALWALVSFIDLYLMSLALRFEPLCGAFGLAPSPHAAMVAYWIVAPQLFFWRGPLTNIMRRRQEREADRFARAAAGGGAELAGALDAVADHNLGAPGAHPWHHAYYSSHPTFRERLAVFEEG